MWCLLALRVLGWPFMKLSSPFFIVSSLLFAACSGGDTPDKEEPRIVDLRSEMGVSDVDVVGVTVSPDTDTRYLLDSERGIFELSTDGTATLFLALEDFPGPDQSLRSAFTDIASIGANRFVLTALGEGYLLDLNTQTLVRHFCYEPGFLPDEERYQLTRSVTFDVRTGQIYAQPQTISQIDDSILASSIGRFDQTNGAEQLWFELSDPNYIAGALTVRTNGDLLLGSDANLRTFDVSGAKWGATVSLAAYGVSEITGMTIDPSTDTLLVIDGNSDELIELPRSILDRD